MRRWLSIAVVAAGTAIWSPSVAIADMDIKQLRSIRSASTSLRQAVLTVERDLKGKAYSAIATITDGAVIYTVKIDTGDKTMTAEVDSKSGKVMQSGAAPTDSTAHLKEFGKVKGTLLAAMKAAESTAKGKSFAGVFKRLGNKDVFEIDVAARDDSEKDVVVDAASGKIRKVAEKSADIAAPSLTVVPAFGAVAQ